MKTLLAPGFKARMLGMNGWFSTNILGNRDGEVLEDPGSFKTKEETKLSVLEQILQPELYPDLYKDLYHAVRINYYPPRGDSKEGWDNIDIFGWLGYPMQIKIDFLCRDSILAAPLVLDLVLFLDLAQRAGMKGIQEWLSFYFKGPMTAAGLYPEHDIFIQLMKLKNTLRWMQGEDLHYPFRPRILRLGTTAPAKGPSTPSASALATFLPTAMTPQAPRRPSVVHGSPMTRSTGSVNDVVLDDLQLPRPWFSGLRRAD